MPDDFIPPHNIEAEQSAIGSMLIEPEAAVVGLSMLKPDDFYRPSHRRFFELFAEIKAKDIPIDAVSLGDELRGRGEMDADTAEYIMNLHRIVPTATNIKHYCEIVKDKAIRRRVIDTCRWNIENVLDESKDDVLAKLQESVQTCCQDCAITRWAVASDMASKVADAWMAPNKSKPITYGLPGLDRILGGVRVGDGELTIVGARPSNGKTAFLNMLAMNTVWAGYRVLYFSLETDAERLCSFMASNIGKVDVWRLEHNCYTLDEETEVAARYADALNDVHQMSDRLLICDTVTELPVLMNEAQSMVKRYASDERPVGSILIDYAQIIEPGVNCRDLRSQTVTIIKRLHELTYRLKVPVVVASQVTTRHDDIDNPPRKEHLAEAPGAIVAAADKIIMIHNPPPRKGVTPSPRPTVFLAEKHKRGMTGQISAIFYGTVQRFTETPLEELEND